MPAADAFWRVLLAVATSALAGAAGPVTWMVAGVVGFLAADGPLSVVAGLVAIAGAVALARRRPFHPLVPSAVGAAAAAVALHLPTAPGSVSGALPAAVIVVTVVGTGMLRLRGQPGRLVRVGAMGGLVVILLATALGVRQMWTARSAFNRGIDTSQRAVDLVRDNRGTEAVASFERAGDDFHDARHLMDGPLGRVSRWVPWVGVQMRAMSDAGLTGADLARSGAKVVAANNLEGLRLEDGTMPMRAIVGLEPGLASAVDALDLGLRRLDHIRSPWLLGPIDDRLDEAEQKVLDARADGERALVAARVLPPMLGAHGKRRYFLALVTPAEARGSGGFVGNYAEISADGSKLKMPVQGRDSDLQYHTDPTARRLTGLGDFMSHYGRFQPAATWANVSMSPDFPTTTDVIAQLYPQSGGSPIDGVISLDPIGLAALLHVIGPIHVDRWPESIDSTNVTRVLFIDQYVRYPDVDVRRELLDEITRAAFDKFTNARFTSPKALVDLLAPAVAGRHLMISSTHADDMASLEELGLAGKVPAVKGDFLSVVTQNGSGNKIDSFLHRDIRYAAHLDPASGAIKATATVSLRNEAPSTGLPRYIIGNSFEPPLPDGTSNLYVSVYTPWNLTAGRVDGVEQTFDVDTDLDRRSYSRFVEIPAGRTVTITLELSGTGPFTNGYHLDVFHQTQVNPDRVSVDVSAPPAWRSPDPPGGKRIVPGRVVETDTDSVLDLVPTSPRS